MVRRNDNQVERQLHCSSCKKKTKNIVGRDILILELNFVQFSSVSQENRKMSKADKSFNLASQKQ